MIFKSVAYRLGKGRNIHGRFSGNSFKLLYQAEEEGSQVVRSKIVKRRAGYVEVTKGEEEFEAQEVVPLKNSYFASRGDKQIKIIRDV